MGVLPGRDTKKLQGAKGDCSGGSANSPDVHPAAYPFGVHPSFLRSEGSTKGSSVASLHWLVSSVAAENQKDCT